MPILELADMTWTEVRDLDRSRTVIILPVGAIEAHGPHLPLGTNVLIARRIAVDLSVEFGVLRAPTIYYGVNVGTARAYAGTASTTSNRLIKRRKDAKR